MKNTSHTSLVFSLALTVGTLTACAQSPAPIVHAGRSAAYSGAASVEGSAAVPVWASGAVAQGSGTVVQASGAASVEVGKAATQGAGALWDFATGDASVRPPLNRTVGIPMAKAMPAKDPSPAEALRQTR